MSMGAQVRDPLRFEHVVYRVYGHHGELLYVGCTSTFRHRWAQHRAKAAWFHQVKQIVKEGPYNYETGRRLEAEAIRDEHPSYNRHHRRFRTVDEAEFARRSGRRSAVA